MIRFPAEALYVSTQIVQAIQAKLAAGRIAVSEVSPSRQKLQRTPVTHTAASSTDAEEAHPLAARARALAGDVLERAGSRLHEGTGPDAKGQAPSMRQRLEQALEAADRERRRLQDARRDLKDLRFRVKMLDKRLRDAEHDLERLGRDNAQLSERATE